MTARHCIDNKNKLIITTLKGKAFDSGFIDAMKKYQKEFQSNPDYTNYNEVLDFSKVTSIAVTITGIRQVGKIASNTDGNNIRRKLAIIAPSNKLFFFARMYKAFRSLPKNSNKEVQIFSNEAKAFGWATK